MDLRNPGTLLRPGAWLPALACLLVIWPAVSEAAPWKPVLPTDGAARARLQPASGAQPETRHSYAWLDPGDEVTYDVRGQGQLRIRTRPVYADATDDPVFRHSVCYDDTTCRRFKRRSAVDGEYRLQRVEGPLPVLGAPLLLGEEDVLEIETPAVDGPFTLKNRSGTKSILVRVLVRDGLEPAPSGIAAAVPEPVANPVRTRLRWRIEPLQLGYDSNAYLAPADSNDAIGKLYWPLRARVDWRRSDNGFTWSADYAFFARIYDERILNEYRNRLSAEQAWRPDRNSRLRPFRFALEESFATKNETFFGRGDDAEFETLVDGAALSLEDRFDSWTFAAGPAVTWYAHDAVDLTGTFLWKRRDYREDYAEYPDIYALDQDRLEMELEVDWEASRRLDVTVLAGLTDKRYDEKYSRDAGGDEIRAETARYVKTWAQLEVDWGDRSGPRLGAELKYYRNRDRYAGYWDSDGFAVEGLAGWETAAGHRILARVRRSHTGYDRSHVRNDPSEPLRSKTVWNVRLYGRYRFGDRIEGIARLHYKDYDYNSRLFAYTRLLTRAGVRFTF